MALETQSLDLLKQHLQTLESGFDDMPAYEPAVNLEQLSSVLADVANKMQDNFPYAHPLYAGQMLKPPHSVARLAYFLAMWINPNNHALDGGRASSVMEKEAVAELAKMFGWHTEHLGHLTSGGTVANMEALWVAGRLHPEKKILASEQAHYTHARISEVLKLKFESVPAGRNARMNIDALEAQLKTGEVGTIVATLGTTGVGSVDPLDEILALAEKYQCRVHVDAAYGGYFKLASNLGANAETAFAAINRADSIVVDPHKCGLQPYGCGCILFRDPSVGAIYKHDSPYTYFSSDELHLGEISLECSRAGASAVALWATQQLLPMQAGGEFARGIENSRTAALRFYHLLADDADELTVFEPELDIVVWAPHARSASEISMLSQTLFDRAAESHLHLALMKLPAQLLKPAWPEVIFDQEEVTCLRSCLMKAEHLEWLDKIWAIYKQVRANVAP